LSQLTQTGLVWIVPSPLTNNMLAVTDSSSSFRWPCRRSSNARLCSRLPTGNAPLWLGGVSSRFPWLLLLLCRCGCRGRIDALPGEREQLARKPVGVNTDYPGCDGGGDHGRGSRASESAPTGGGGLALSRCSTVVKISSVSPMFSMSWSRYSPGPNRKCLVSPAT
jgi:hypothetical protein